MLYKKIFYYSIIGLLGSSSCTFASEEQKEVSSIKKLTIDYDASPDVLIVGAGASGLTLAIDLARRGISFKLIDKLEGPFQGSRGKGIQPRSQEIFEDLNILDRIVSIGGLYPPQREYTKDGEYKESAVVEMQLPSSEEPYHIPLLVPQFSTELVMREQLATLGHHPQFSCELKSFVQDGEGVTAYLRNQTREEIIRARYLIGADGGRSSVRHLLHLDFPGKTLGVRAIVADVQIEGIGTEAWHRWNEGNMSSQISLCPLPGTNLFQLQAPIPLEGDIDLSAEGLTTLISQRTDRNSIRIHTVSWASAFNMNARLAERYHIGRIFLTGDAAHIHPPTGGQGLNTSVQDSYNLGWKLASVLKGAPDELLSTYEEERRPIAAQMLGLTTNLLEEAKKGIMKRGRNVNQLDLGYPFSSLSLKTSTRTKGLIAGERAPDALVQGAAGQPTRLFKLFQGPHWTLLGYEADRSMIKPRFGLHIHSIGAKGDIIDESNCFHNSYSVEAGDWVLVRPDGYIGAIVSSDNITTLEDYLISVGLKL